MKFTISIYHRFQWVLAVPKLIMRVSYFLFSWGRYLYLRYVQPLKQRLLKAGGRCLPWVIAVFMGAWLAYAIQTLQVSQVIAAFLGLLLSIVFIMHPEYAAIVIVMLSATIVSVSAIPRPFTIGGQGFGATELLIIFMLPVLFVRTHSDRSFVYPRSPIMLPMIFFLGSVVLSIVVTYQQYLESPRGPFPFADVYNSVRPMFYYLTFFVVLFAIDTKKKLRMMLRTVMWMACIVAVMMVIQYFLGTKRWIFIGSPDSLYVGSQSSDSDIARPLPPGLALVLMMFVVVVSMSTYKKQKAGLMISMLAAVTLGVGLVFTYARIYWISTFVSIVIVWLVVNRKAKQRLGISVVASIVAIVLLSVAVGRMAPGEAGREFATNMQERFVSIFQKKTVNTSSIQNRINENHYAMQQIRRSPLFGVGAGNPVGYMYSTTIRGDYFITPKRAIHNSYLELYMVYGLFGFASFVWLSLAFFLRGIYIYRHLRDPASRSIILGLQAAYVGFLIRSAASMALLHEIHNITAATLILALTEVVWRVRQDQQPPKREHVDNMVPTLAAPRS